MKRIVLICMAVCAFITGYSQDEKTEKVEKNDTIRIGNITIIKKAGEKDQETPSRDKEVKIPFRKRDKENISTNWWIVDLGYSGLNDKTNYSSAEAQAFAPGSTEDWFDLRSGKSRNVNVWFFMQRLNLVSHVVNLKYGMGVELNNYRFDDESIRFQKNPTKIIQDVNLKDAKKNKLAADYLTVPMMLNFNFTPGRKDGFGVSGGMSAGFLYASRQKTKLNDVKTRLRSDFDLNRWKLSYVGELLLGPVKLYGSYALDNMWDKGLDHTPYNVGFRLSNW